VSDFPLPLLGFCAFSGTGKTTLLRKLIPQLQREGLRVGVVKHAHHSFDIDHPGKDSYELRKAGASQMLVASRHRLAWIAESPHNETEPSLTEVLARLDHSKLDLVLVEGFKHARLAKIELHRPALGKPLMYPDDTDIIALASDTPIDTGTAPVQLDLNDVNAIAKFVLKFVAQQIAHPGVRQGKPAAC
jgi:molybdopterin-guanine dinucleotide biosynthesis protein MobB